MAQTRKSQKSAQRAITPVDSESAIPLAMLTGSTAKDKTNGDRPKHQRKVGNVATEPEQLAPVKKAVGRPKRQHNEVDEAATVESEQLAPTKKARVTCTTDPNTPRLQSPARRSNRARTQTLPGAQAAQKRKQRTKEEIAADKAKADAEKKKWEELTKENHRALEQMDIHEDISRAETAIRTIRTFGDLNRDSEMDGEEFVGFNNIASSDSDTDGHTEDPVNLKVRYLYQF